MAQGKSYGSAVKQAAYIIAARKAKANKQPNMV
jgi:uncharacterized protein YoaH (UPF0181 family)